MLLIPCPHCGPRSHVEFTYAGDAGLRRPADDAPLAAWADYVYLRDNPRGPHREYWHHVHGCRAYVRVERDTATHAIVSSDGGGA
jgi:methylglutamate dehydrogenase subunit B